MTSGECKQVYETLVECGQLVKGLMSAKCEGGNGDGKLRVLWDRIGRDAELALREHLGQRK